MPAAHAADTSTAADPRSRKRKRAALKRTDAKKIERKKISSQPKGSSIFFVSFNKQERADFHQLVLGGGRWIRTTEVTDNRFTVCPLWPLGNSPIFTCALKRKLGAGRRTRTPDLLITNQLLYQLSYTSISATEWILADAAPFVKPKFFVFREEGLLHFKICSPAEKRRPYGRPCGRCSLCGCELLRGECGWYLNGQSVCADCFPAFARAELAPCETVFGMEGEA